jgi:hypothetical protein
MLGVAVHGLLGVDADLQRSAFAAQQQRSVDVRVVDHADYGDCDQAPPPWSKT